MAGVYMCREVSLAQREVVNGVRCTTYIAYRQHMAREYPTYKEMRWSIHWEKHGSSWEGSLHFCRVLNALQEHIFCLVALCLLQVCILSNHKPRQVSVFYALQNKDCIGYQTYRVGKSLWWVDAAGTTHLRLLAQWQHSSGHCLQICTNAVTSANQHKMEIKGGRCGGSQTGACICDILLYSSLLYRMHGSVTNYWSQA